MRMPQSEVASRISLNPKLSPPSGDGGWGEHPTFYGLTPSPGAVTLPPPRQSPVSARLGSESPLPCLCQLGLRVLMWTYKKKHLSQIKPQTMDFLTIWIHLKRMLRQALEDSLIFQVRPPFLKDLWIPAPQLEKMVRRRAKTLRFWRVPKLKIAPDHRAGKYT